MHKEVPESYLFLVMTAHAWGAGKSRAEALRYCRENAGRDVMKKHGYVVYRVPPKFTVSNIDGRVEWPLAEEVNKVGLTKIEDKRTWYKVACPKCHKTSKVQGADKLKCGDCLMNHVEVVEMKRA